MAGYIGSKAVLLSTTAATVTGDMNVDVDTLVVDSTNNRVGIGLTDPNYPLSVGGATGGQYVQIRSDANNSTLGLLFASDVAVNDGAIFYDQSADFMYFRTAGFERMRIDSSGNLFVGTTSAISSSNSGISTIIVSGDYAVLDIGNTRTTSQKTMRFFNGNGEVGSIATSGSATSYNTSSDYRLKEDVQPMSGASDRLMALKPVNFAWKADGSRVDGFLAHEAQEVVPEAVTGQKDAADKDGNPEYQGIDQSKLVPLLTAALQEALTEIETLKARVAALEA